LLHFPQNKFWIFLLLVFALNAGACTYSNVELKEVRQVKIDKLDNQGISFTVTLWIENPNPYRIKVTGTDADLYLSGKHAGKAKLLSNVTVPANFKGPLEASIRTDFNEGSLSLLPVIISAGMRRKVNLRAAGNLRAKSFIIGQKIDFDYTHEAKF
jgi:LEA14-like dessication related protein